MKCINFIFQRNNIIAKIDPALYGSFIEHLGRSVYTGIYEPGHISADKEGFRTDVSDLVKELGVTTARYPGGNFVSGYNWRDGIGPKDKRPVRLDYAWLSRETNQFGINEFSRWCEKTGIRPMIALNLGTGTPQEAGYFLEYCNHAGGTTLSDLRRQHGQEAPYDFTLWCLGNEMDGEWQTCAMDAHDYVKKARETAKIMRWIDPGIQIVACGSSNSMQKTFPEWDRIVLEGLYEQIDFLSCHHYFENRTGKMSDYLGSFLQMENFIRTIVATADYVKAKVGSTKKMMISFDEWNIWSIESDPWQSYFENPKHRFEISPPILEQTYSLLDAVVLGSLLCTLVNHCDRVQMASLAQLVNVIAPISTQPGGKAIRQSIFWPFKMFSQYGRGEVLKYLASIPTLATCYGEAKVVQSATIHNAEKKEIVFFAVNIQETEPLEVSFDFHTFGNVTLMSHVTLKGNDLFSRNTFVSPDEIIPHSLHLTPEQLARNKITLPPVSFNMVVFRTEC